MTILQAFWATLPKRAAMSVAVPLLVIIAFEIITTSLIPYTRKEVMDSLVLLNWSHFLFATGITFSNSIILLSAQGLKEWVSQKLSLFGRETLMNTIKQTWIDKNGHSDVTNPCARLNDDARLSTELAIKVFIEVLISVVIVLSLLFTILKWPLLFWTAIIYSGISIGIALLFRTPMINKKYTLSDSEGNHRAALTKISMQKPDATLASKWSAVKDTYTAYINVCRNYKLFNALQAALMYTLPFWIMAPDYFAGKVSIGDITQGTLTFDLLVLNSTVWVLLYPAITEAQTAFIRIKEFYDSLN